MTTDRPIPEGVTVYPTWVAAMRAATEGNRGAKQPRYGPNPGGRVIVVVESAGRVWLDTVSDREAWNDNGYWSLLNAATALTRRYGYSVTVAIGGTGQANDGVRDLSTLVNQ